MPTYSVLSLASARALVAGDIQVDASTRRVKAALTLATMACTRAFCRGGKYRSAYSLPRASLSADWVASSARCARGPGAGWPPTAVWTAAVSPAKARGSTSAYEWRAWNRR